MNIPSAIRTSALSSDRTETDSHGALGSLLEHVGNTEVLKTVGTFEETVRTGTLGCKAAGSGERPVVNRVDKRATHHAQLAQGSSLDRSGKEDR